jgi:hypothetical protein
LPTLLLIPIPFLLVVVASSSLLLLLLLFGLFGTCMPCGHNMFDESIMPGDLPPFDNTFYIPHSVYYRGSHYKLIDSRAILPSTLVPLIGSALCVSLSRPLCLLFFTTLLMYRRFQRVVVVVVVDLVLVFVVFQSKHQEMVTVCFTQFRLHVGVNTTTHRNSSR